MSNESLTRAERGEKIPRKALVFLAVLTLLTPFESQARSDESHNPLSRIARDIGRRAEEHIKRRGGEIAGRVMDGEWNKFIEKLAHRSIDKRLKERLADALDEKAKLDFELAGMSREHLLRIVTQLNDLIEYAAVHDLDLLKELLGEYTSKDRTQIDEQRKQRAEELINGFVERRMASIDDKARLYERIMEASAFDEDGKSSPQYFEY